MRDHLVAAAIETRTEAGALVGLPQRKKRIDVPGSTVTGAVSVNLRSRHTHVDPHRDVAVSAAEDADMARCATERAPIFSITFADSGDSERPEIGRAHV